LIIINLVRFIIIKVKFIMEQITFSLNNQLSNNFSDFIESSSNRLAFQYIREWPNNFGVFPYSKVLIIKGPKSSGKSFLANLWAKKTHALSLKKNHELTNSILEHHQAFIIDGFDSTWRERDILHYFNILHENNKYLLITLTQMPKLNLADLSSRINSVNKVDISMIDDELMSEINQNSLASKRKITIPFIKQILGNCIL